jgi:hypothetical protein
VPGRASAKPGGFGHVDQEGLKTCRRRLGRNGNRHGIDSTCVGLGEHDARRVKSFYGAIGTREFVPEFVPQPMPRIALVFQCETALDFFPR